ncbi:MAG: lamin tail domain-containing protein [Planctomycetaceae bacterium]|nr:MAG: lamin tail domain-containing protein [Planctomycetaceae bacterium]
MLAPKKSASVVLFLSAMTGLVAAAPSDFDIRISNFPQVVINELHVDPDVKTELVEFVEMHNPGTSELDLSGWRFTSGILDAFPSGAKIAAGEYVIVAQDPSHIHAKWSEGRFPIPAGLVFGPYAGKLDNEGDRIVLCDAQGQVIDEVEYQLGFPWPTVGDPVPADQPGAGCSMQLTSPLFDNDLGGSWRSR